jgi:hypothetical protein
MNTPTRQPLKRATGVKKSKRQPEMLLQKEIVRFLGLNGIFSWVNKNGATYDPVRKAFRASTTLKGISDILGLLTGGRFLAIEVKMPKGYPTPEQKEFLARINRHGGIAFIARSIDDVKKNLGL